MIRVSVYSVAAALSILAATSQPRAMAAQCQALVGADGLRTVALDGSLIRKLSADVASFAVWSPDGRGIAAAFKSGEFRVFAADGSPSLRIVMPAVDPITDLHWILPRMIALKSTHDAPGMIGFMKLSPDLGSGEMLPSGGFGRACMPSPNSGPTACIGDRDIAMLQPGHKEAIFHAVNAIDPTFKQKPVEVRIGETVKTATEPSFQVAITHGKFFKNIDGLPGPAGNFEIQVIPANGQSYMGVRRSGQPYEFGMDGAHWSFVLNTLDSAHTRFRIDIYKDDSEPKMTGIEWGRDGSRVFIWETTRRGDALLTVTMTGREWALTRSAMRLESGTPHATMTVHNGLNIDPDGKSAIAESGRTVYRCEVDAAVCKPIASRPPDLLDTRVGGATIQTKVLDWNCPAGN